MGNAPGPKFKKGGAVGPKMGKSPGLKLKNKMASGCFGYVNAAVGIGRRVCKAAACVCVVEGEPSVGVLRAVWSVAGR